MASKKEYQQMLINLLNTPELTQESLEEDTATLVEEAFSVLADDGITDDAEEDAHQGEFEMDEE